MIYCTVNVAVLLSILPVMLGMCSTEKGTVTADIDLHFLIHALIISLSKLSRPTIALSYKFN